ncbi:unnamed protein product [Clonostachys byssicola]|uniref:Uncharacterized protein n=1 Tax=Clonostachys byssicola TaxID=160290 RepID=A0A9N9UT50_9HYPO|nr:unnamed protein product [Clonostachys byssicola]
MDTPRNTPVKRRLGENDPRGDDQYEENETAASYARKEQCTWDHRKAPYRFESCVFTLSPSHEARDAQGLIDQDGLAAARLPETQDFDTLANCSSPPSFAFQPARSLRDRGFLLELVNVGSDPAEDVKEYLTLVESANSCRLVDQWLPLCPTETRHDEGLSFPERSSWVHSLLLRALDKEQIELSKTSLELEAEVANPKKCPPRKLPVRLDFPCAKYRAKELLPVSPPLSPVSDDDGDDDGNAYFVPSEGVCIIDLTSEPDSPEKDMTFEKVVQQIPDPGPPIPISYENFPSLETSPITLAISTHSKEDPRLDVPLVSSASSTRTYENALQNDILELNTGCNEEDPIDEPIGGFFDEAFNATVEACHSRSMLLVGQECFNPHESISRVPVPRLELYVPPEEYTGISEPKDLFRRMNAKNKLAFSIHKEQCSSELSTILKWDPFNHSRIGHFSAIEDLEPLTDKSEELLAIPSSPRKGNFDHATKERKLAILTFDEKDLEDISESESLNSPSDHATSSDRTLGQISQEPEFNFLESIRFSSLGHLPRSNMNKKPDLFLPLASDGAATSKLLASFMELSGAKSSSEVPSSGEPSEHPDTSSKNKYGRQAAQTIVSSESALPSTSTPELVPAEVPKFTEPDRHGVFLVSLNIDHYILRQLERYWPPGCLIDRDISNCKNWYLSDADETGRESSNSPELSDCDIILTSSVGIIITSLVKAKQTQLPGSTKRPELQARIISASERYETLFVLVSEENLSGEVVGNPNPSDVAAYAEFVNFTLSLGANVISHYVPGATDTLAKWIASFMSHYTPYVLEIKRFLTCQETNWGMFLRQAGMNAMASQVLAGVLFEESGNRGLVSFLVMPIQERISKYAQILGGQKQLEGVSKILDEAWG